MFNVGTVFEGEFQLLTAHFRGQNVTAIVTFYSNHLRFPFVISSRSDSLIEFDCPPCFCSVRVAHLLMSIWSFVESSLLLSPCYDYLTERYFG